LPQLYKAEYIQKKRIEDMEEDLTNIKKDMESMRGYYKKKYLYYFHGIHMDNDF
jgi:hypothetical protein